jgi:hypothetical protein
MIDNPVTPLVRAEDEDFIRVRSKDSELLLGISKALFHRECARYNWPKENLGQNMIYHHVPKAYYERRQKELQTFGRKSTKQEPIAIVETKSETPDTNLYTMVENTYSKLLEEKDKRIEDLEKQITLIQQHQQQLLTAKDDIIKAKEQETLTLKASMLMLSNDSNQNPEAKNPTTLTYQQVLPQKPWWKWF